MRLVVMFDNFGPYHLARFAAAIERGRQEGVAVFGLETTGKSRDYAWTTGHHEVRGQIVTLFPESMNGKAALSTVVARVWRALSTLKPDVLAIAGYLGTVSLTALLWAKTHRILTILMAASSRQDKTRNPLMEWGKRTTVRRFDAALVGGTRQREYAAELGIPRPRIFLGYDVVDNEYFTRETAEVRRQENVWRRQSGLLRPYFLTVSRFIGKKNLPFLLDAYGRYRDLAGEKAWDLVLCGSGPLEASLRNQAGGIPGVHFPGFVQAEELPRYYGLAATFIIPSSHYEQWGLVVNEAMASGLPVLVSRVCGCTPDLVQEGVNGFTFDPRDTEGLARLMGRMSSGEVDLKALAQASQRIISAWTPGTFAENLFKAIKSAMH